MSCRRWALPTCSPDSRRALRLLALAIMLLVGPAASADASDASDAPNASARIVGLSASGVRCETRNRPLDVGQDNFVLDRVTECAFESWLSPSLITRSNALPEPVCASETRRLDASPVAPDRAAPAAPLDPAAIARWAEDRTVLGNTQYDRTLRAMRGVFPRRER